MPRNRVPLALYAKIVLLALVVVSIGVPPSSARAATAWHGLATAPTWPGLDAVPIGPGLAAAPEPVASGWLSWPLAGTPAVVRAFDPPDQPWLPGHRGVDLAARSGESVRAAGPGVVAFAGELAGRGVVSIVHPSGIRTTYEPLRAVVTVGERVATGTPIGVVASGHTGCPAPACLHWGARRGDTYLDPIALIGPPRLRLKPLAG